MTRHRHLLPFAVLAMSLALSLVAAHAQDSASADKPLSAYRDKNRVLLLFAPGAQDPAYLEQTRLCQGEKAGFEERQLVVVPLLADAKKQPAADGSGSPAAKKFGVDTKAFALVLLGKDGHDAFRSAKPVPAAAIYGVIDAMPMRRAEMKRPSPTPAKPDLDHDE